jgi:rhodanese-related sulfurtransferase
MERDLIDCEDLDRIMNSDDRFFLVRSSLKPFSRGIPGSIQVKPPMKLAELGTTLANLTAAINASLNLGTEGRLQSGRSQYPLSSGARPGQIGKDAYIVCYDQDGVEGAARLWWYLKAASYKRVKVLAGGLRRWEAEVDEVDNFDPEPWQALEPTSYEADASKFIDRADLPGLSASSSQHLIASPTSALMRSLFTMEGNLKPQESLKSHFLSLNVSLGEEVTTIVSGDLAGTLLLALHQLGVKNLSLLQEPVGVRASVASEMTDFYSVDPMSSYLSGCDLYFSPHRSFVGEASVQPVEYKTVNVLIGGGKLMTYDARLSDRRNCCGIQ